MVKPSIKRTSLFTTPQTNTSSVLPSSISLSTFDDVSRATEKPVSENTSQTSVVESADLKKLVTLTKKKGGKYFCLSSTLLMNFKVDMSE